MAIVWGWFADNWFNLVQSAGIVAGFVCTAVALRREVRTRRMEATLTLGEHHRELWSELHRRPELSRLLAQEVDLVASPVTAAEEEYLNTVFVHYCTGWKMAAEYQLLSPDDLLRDLASFLTHPIPKHVWERTRGIRESGFLEFADKALRRSQRARRKSTSTGSGC